MTIRREVVAELRDWIIDERRMAKQAGFKLPSTAAVGSFLKQLSGRAAPFVDTAKLRAEKIFSNIPPKFRPAYKGLVGAGGLYTAASMAQPVISSAMTGDIRADITKARDDPDAFSDMARRVKKVIGRRGLDLKVDNSNNLFGPYFNPLDRTINVNTSYGDVAAHEMGHALNHETIGTFGTVAPRLLRDMGTPLAGLGMFARGGRSRKYAPLVAALLGLPTLAEEALASVRGVRNYGDDLEMGPGAYGRLGRAFGTYALDTAKWPAILYALSRLAGNKWVRGL